MSSGQKCPDTGIALLLLIIPHFPIKFKFGRYAKSIADLTVIRHAAAGDYGNTVQKSASTAIKITQTPTQKLNSFLTVDDSNKNKSVIALPIFGMSIAPLRKESTTSGFPVFRLT